MFDPSFPELALVIVIGLLVLGPERLPKVASQIGRWVGKARRTANQLRHQLEREIALSEIAEKQKQREQAPPPAPTTSTAEGETGVSNVPPDASNDHDGGPPASP
jgi:Tat protein translocase TatB subunit